MKYKVEEVAVWLGIGRTRTRSLLKLLVNDGKVAETGMKKRRDIKSGKKSRNAGCMFCIVRDAG